MIFRTYENGDYDQIIDLWQAAGIQPTRSDTPAGLASILTRDPDLFFVMEDAGRIIGVVMGRYDGRRAWVNHLAVDPGRQGEGLGSALMDELEHRLRSLGCEKVNLLIAPSNGAVQGFYARLGYHRDDLIFMEKWITEQ